ncbi:MAG TPA: glycosyltransferase, partial [Devosia sp.]|nr:glycosyltransferase [Devosia sp.]
PALHRELLGRLRAQNAFIVGYAGALGTANAMDRLVSSLQRTDPSVHLVAVGEGEKRSALQGLAQQLGVAERLHLLPPVSREQVATLLAAVDVAYAGLRGGRLYGLGAGLTKLNDYLLAARPVVYAGADPGNAIELSGAGVCADPDDIGAIASAIETLRAMPEGERRALGERGRVWCLQNRLPARQAAAILHALAGLPESGELPAD